MSLWLSASLPRGLLLTTAGLYAPLQEGSPPAGSVVCEGSFLLDLQPNELDLERLAGEQRERHRDRCRNLDNLVYKL